MKNTLFHHIFPWKWLKFVHLHNLVMKWTHVLVNKVVYFIIFKILPILMMSWFFLSSSSFLFLCAWLPKTSFRVLKFQKEFWYPLITCKMVREDKASWKANYFLKLVQLFDEYPKCFLVRFSTYFKLPHVFGKTCIFLRFSQYFEVWKSTPHLS